MGIDGITLSNGVTGILLLSDTYRTLNGRRTDIDWRIATLAPDDPTRGILWQKLELLLTKLRKTVSDLARSPATHLLELQAKAVVLATLLQPGETGGGPVISEDERTALALS